MPLSRYRLPILNSLLLLVLVASVLCRRVDGLAPHHPDFLRQLPLPFRDWATSDVEITMRDRQLLEPDAVLVRAYQSRQGARQQAELAVIAGHRKKTVHTPGFCMMGGGWETLWQQDTTLTLSDRQIDTTQALMSREQRQILVTYFFTDGDYCTHNLLQFQGMQILQRFRARASLGALARIIVPVQGDETTARALTADFARATLPTVLATLRRARHEIE
jgi:EpsI family protein